MPDPTTPAEARAMYHPGLDIIGWHTQPRCECGDYLAQHEEQAPHPCALRWQGGPGIACRCHSYQPSPNRYTRDEVLRWPAFRHLKGSKDNP